VTTWVAPQLLPGAFGVPVPTLLITPWQLSARVMGAHMDLSDETDEDETDEDETTDDEAMHQQVPAMAGFTQVLTAGDWLSVEPAYPLTVYRSEKHGLHVAFQPGELWSLVSIGSSNATWDEAAASAGRVMVATADLPLYWHAVDDGRFPTFQDAFGTGSWAALAPFDTGPEADLSKWPGAKQLGL